MCNTYSLFVSYLFHYHIAPCVRRNKCNVCFSSVHFYLLACLLVEIDCGVALIGLNPCYLDCLTIRDIICVTLRINGIVD